MLVPPDIPVVFCDAVSPAVAGLFVPALARVSAVAAVPTAADVSSATGVTNISGFPLLVPLLLLASLLLLAACHEVGTPAFVVYFCCQHY